jgi:hypothetical protein
VIATPDLHVIAKPHFAVIALPDLCHVIAKPDRCGPDLHVIAKPHFAVIALPDLCHVIAKPDRCEPDLHVIAKPHFAVIALPDLFHVIAPALATRRRRPGVAIVVHVLGQKGLVVPAFATTFRRHTAVVATSCRPRPHLWMRKVPGPKVVELAVYLEGERLLVRVRELLRVTLELLRLAREVLRVTLEVLRLAALPPAVGVPSAG